jgi:hypothetical protein
MPNPMPAYQDGYQSGQVAMSRQSARAEPRKPQSVEKGEKRQQEK